MFMLCSLRHTLSAIRLSSITARPCTVSFDHLVGAVEGDDRIRQHNEAATRRTSERRDLAIVVRQLANHGRYRHQTKRRGGGRHCIALHHLGRRIGCQYEDPSGMWCYLLEQFWPP